MSVGDYVSNPKYAGLLPRTTRGHQISRSVVGNPLNNQTVVGSIRPGMKGKLDSVRLKNKLDHGLESLDYMKISLDIIRRGPSRDGSLQRKYK